jgi:adenylate cyclase
MAGRREVGLTGRVFDQAVERKIGAAEAGALAATLLEGDPAAVRARVAEMIHRFSVLVDIVKLSESVSLDLLLPRLMDFISEALDADRATLFLHDREAHQLFSRVLRGDGVSEIRIPDNAGIAGAVFTEGEAALIDDAYRDPRFNQEVDRRTGYRTKTILCVPLRNRSGQAIGVTQVLNKRGGSFTAADQGLLESITVQAAAALENAQLFERLERARRDEEQLLEVSESISSELQLEKLLARIVTATTTLLDAERSTLFVHDPKTSQLWSRVAEGSEAKEIRIPSNAGIAGAVFTRRTLENIPDAYADPRFNQEVDRKTGYRTRSILACPVLDRLGSPVGVIQVLNKRGGPFGPLDERRIKAFSSQAAIAIQNAQLFEDVLELKNYNESILKSLSNGVVTLDAELRVVKANEAANRILNLGETEIGGTAERLFGGENPWLMKSLAYVGETGGSDYHADVDYRTGQGASVSVNVTINPLTSMEGKTIGYMIVFEDITREKRMRSTMARYMAKEVVERLLANQDEILQGTTTTATVLFSDIRRFTTLAESLTARETVKMLNEYFTDMVEIVFQHGGILDKYIGDAIMATFGAPIETADDASHAVLVANEMIRSLRRMNLRRAEQDLVPLEIGIGLATGEVLAGSIGSAKRLDYTVIGDSVNLASRLESATKHYGAWILLDGATVANIKEPKLLRRVDLLQVKGKVKPAEVYESLDHHTPETFPNLAEAIGRFNDSMARYGRREWGGALAGFGEVLRLNPNDGPSKVYVNRSRYYLENPPGDDWDGVWAMTEK